MCSFLAHPVCVLTIRSSLQARWPVLYLRVLVNVVLFLKQKAKLLIVASVSRLQIKLRWIQNKSCQVLDDASDAGFEHCSQWYISYCNNHEFHFHSRTVCSRSCTQYIKHPASPPCQASVRAEKMSASHSPT